MSAVLLARVGAMNGHGLGYLPESEAEMESLLLLAEEGKVVEISFASGYRLPNVLVTPPERDDAQIAALHAAGHGQMRPLDRTPRPNVRKPYAVVNVWYDGTAFQPDSSSCYALLVEALDRQLIQRSFRNNRVVERTVVIDLRTGEDVA